MFSSAVMRWPQDGHAERGTARFSFSAAGAGAPVSSAQSVFHCRSSMRGRRWMTTFRKLPTTRPTTTAATMNSQGAALKTSTIVIARRGVRREADFVGPEQVTPHSPRPPPHLFSDRLAHLEDREIHGDDQAADQRAQHDHDHRFHEGG